jgi:arsenate reductase (thioredoxin)
MAQPFFERRAPEDIRAESAGSDPATAVWPAVIEAMEEVGVDLRGPRPQKLMVEMQLHADWAVTMGCGDVCPYVPTTVEDWDLPDPAGKAVGEVRQIRDEIEERVRDLIVDRLPDIRSDRTAHQMRLLRLLPPPVKEFGDRRSDAEIRACADAVLAQHADAPVRSVAMTLTHRRTRECLKRETCDLLRV